MRRTTPAAIRAGPKRRARAVTRVARRCACSQISRWVTRPFIRHFGVGEVTASSAVRSRRRLKAFYVLRIIDTGMKVMVPTASVESVGLRGVMSPKEADSVLAVFRSAEKAVDGGPWNRRQRAYNEMIKSGSPFEVAKVLRDLYRIKFQNEKDLSYGERKLMDRRGASS
ncbi:MAG: CarD family transcriptional regulator [Polyangiales bacterium]